ncbi:MAG: LysM peptidoglycan-binding domain-containing protein [Clostridia bacterium]
MYKVYLGEILLPVAPSEINIKAENQNEILSLLNHGQFNVLKKPGLKEYSFTVMLPLLPYHFAQYSGSFYTPSYYTDFIEELKSNQSVFDFTIIDTYNSEYLNKLVNLESYSISDKGDVYVDIVLKEYVSYSTKVLSISDDILKVEVETVRVDTSVAVTGTLYTIVSGDTLIGIAIKKYGDSSMWKEIYEYNATIIDSIATKYGYSTGGWWIFPGTVITLP